MPIMCSVLTFKLCEFVISAALTLENIVQVELIETNCNFEELHSRHSWTQDIKTNEPYRMKWHVAQFSRYSIWTIGMSYLMPETLGYLQLCTNWFVLKKKTKKHVNKLTKLHGHKSCLTGKNCIGQGGNNGWNLPNVLLYVL